MIMALFKQKNQPHPYGRFRYLLTNTFTSKNEEKRPMKMLGHHIRITT